MRLPHQRFTPLATSPPPPEMWCMNFLWSLVLGIWRFPPLPHHFGSPSAATGDRKPLKNGLFNNLYG